MSEKAKAQLDNTFQYPELVKEILREHAYYNFWKMHLISYYVEQIPKFSSLPKYSTDITKYMNKGFKDAYNNSNKVNLLS